MRYGGFRVRKTEYNGHIAPTITPPLSPPRPPVIEENVRNIFVPHASVSQRESDNVLRIFLHKLSLPNQFVA